MKRTTGHEGRLVAAFLGASVAFGCTVERTIGDEVDDSADAPETVGDQGGDGDGDGDDGPATGAELDAIDILFVVDNSGSMGDTQARLIAAAEQMTDAFDARGVDYHVGFTTTDFGNVECSGTSPEGGSLRLRSCHDRATEFTWPKVNPTVQVFDTACAANCDQAVSQSLHIVPTAIEPGGQAAARPWIQRIDGETNLAYSSIAEAIGCYAPQGVDGCGFESPIKAAVRAVQRMNMPGAPEYGFLRDGVPLAVIIVTDEADCSANEPLQSEVFGRLLPAKDKVFWEDPMSSIPTSAICWHAGVACTGSSAGYGACEAVDFAEDGSETTDPDVAVLDTLDELSAVLRDVETTKKQVNDRARVLVSVIGGVPAGYAAGMADIVYKDSADPVTQANFGIDWGCERSTGGVTHGAIPPVRLRNFAERFDVDDGTRNLSSLCADDFDGGLMHVVAEFDRLNEL